MNKDFLTGSLFGVVVGVVGLIVTCFAVAKHTKLKSRKEKENEDQEYSVGGDNE